MMPSATCRMASRCSMACGFSSLAMIQVSLPMRGHAIAHQAYVLGGAHEGNRDGVDPVLERELKIFGVLLGERGRAHQRRRED